MKKCHVIITTFVFSLFLSQFSSASADTQSPLPKQPDQWATTHVVSPISNNKSKPASQTAIETIKVKEMKDMIGKLIRQDEYPDEIFELIEDSNNKLTMQDIEAMSLTLKLIRNNVDHILFLAKKQFSEVQPFQGLSKYTKTMLSYTNKLDKKISFLNRTISISINKKSKMRDALSSKKTPKFQGKKLTLILEEKKAMQKLSEHIKQLQSCSRKLNATSKWLHIVSR